MTVEQKKLDTIVSSELDPALEYKGSIMRRLSDIARSTSGKVTASVLSFLAGTMIYFARPNKGIAQSVVENSGYSLVNENNHIRNIEQFLDSCPKNDPAYEQIKKDFKIRRNGVLVDLDSVKCTEPTSLMSEADWSDELAQLQALRVEYYMDFGMSGHLPWTESAGYDWVRSLVNGINVRDDYLSPACCEKIGNELYFIMNPRKEKAKWLGTSWKNLSGDISSHWHELRHAPGTNFPHVSCNGHDTMDQTFDINNLSPFGAQWWLNYLWLKGVINIGVSCLDSSEKADINNRYLLETQMKSHAFCDNSPPAVGMPSLPAGPCVGASVSGTLKDSFGNTLDDIIVEAVNSDGIDLLGNKSFVAAGVVTDTNGGFKVVRLLGNYKLFAEPDECFVPQWFDNKQSEATADALALLDGMSLPVNITLQADNIPGPKVSGPNSKKGISQTYTATRNPNATNNPVNYFFDWGDGTNSGWLESNQATKAYASTGNYDINAKTMCKIHGIESLVGEPLHVLISNPDGPDLKAQWTAGPYQICTKPKKGLPKCTLRGGILQVVNAGNQKSGTASVAFYLSTDNEFDAGDFYLKRSSVAALKPTRTKNVSLTQKLATGATAKDQYIIAVINLPTDIDTTNNTIVYGPIE